MSETISRTPMKVGGPPAAATPASRLRLTFAERLTSTFTTPFVAFPVIILSLALLAWTAAAHIGARRLVVNARPRTTADTNAAVTAEAVAELEAKARLAAQQLIHDRTIIARTLSRLEQQARAAGFQAEISLKPGVTNAAGFKELTVHPASIALENDNDRDGRSFNRLLAWLREASHPGTKIEVAGLSLRSRGDRLTSAQVELNFWSIDEHDKPAAK